MIEAPPSSRYECLVKVASGGMATVYVGRLRGRHGFSRLVAIKRAHAHLLEDEALRRGLIGEARLAAQIHDPHVVSVLDVDEPNGELMLIMDYVEGGSLSQLLANANKRAELLPPGVVTRILLDACAGLAAAHELRDGNGAPLAIVHRDVSPHNILVGVDGLSRIADFGIAKWAEATHATSTGLKGKFSYMAPEYIETRKLDQRADVFALGVVAWEALSGKRLFRGEDELATMRQVLTLQPPLVSSVAAGVPAELDEPVARALAKDPKERFANARDLGRALQIAAERAGLDLSAGEVTSAVRQLLGDVLDARRTLLRALCETNGSGSERRAGLDGSASTTVEGVHTATATLDAAFATDARTLPLERPRKPDHPSDLAVPQPNVVRKASLSLQRALVIATIAACGALVLALAWPFQRTAPRPSPALGAGASLTLPSVAAADPPPVPSEAAVDALPATPGIPSSSAASVAPRASPGTASIALPPPLRKPSKARPPLSSTKALDKSAAPAASLPTSVPSATAPARPGLGY